MSIMDSKATLSAASKELFARWQDVKVVWSDAKSAEFEKLFLSVIEQDVRSAFSGFDHMDQVLQRLKNDCE
jgi:hypothetical protein